MKDVSRNDEAVSSLLGVVLVLGLTVMVAGVIGAQAIELGNSQPEFAHGGVVTEFNGNSNIEVSYLIRGGTADYIEVTFTNGSTTGVARLHTSGAQATFADGVINTTGDAETVSQPSRSLGENVLVTAVAFESENRGRYSTLVYRGCRGRCTSFGDESTSSGDKSSNSNNLGAESTCNKEEDKDAGHGNNCNGVDSDNPGKGADKGNPGRGRDNPGRGNNGRSPGKGN